MLFVVLSIVYRLCFASGITKSSLLSHNCYDLLLRRESLNYLQMPRKSRSLALNVNEISNIDGKPDRLVELEKMKVPTHIAVIMDGNRRFGNLKYSDPIQGHWAGGQMLVDFVQWCIAEGVLIVTAYAFSTENWNRDPFEVQTLMTIFIKFANSFQKEALEKNIKVNILISDTQQLPALVLKSIQNLERKTSNCDGFILNICLSYGGRNEIIGACKKICKKVLDGEIDINQIKESDMEKNLLTDGIPDPDILIRTSGEHRLSNFLLWQMAYTELFFVDKYWPELTQADLKEILKGYNSRQRRYGV